MRRYILFSVVSLVFAATASGAVQQGDTELEFLGGWFQQNANAGGTDLDAFFLSGAIGYFVTDNIQVQGVALGAWLSQDFGGGFEVDTDIYAIGARGKYHFMPTNQWVPYVGGQLLWANLDAGGGDIDGILWGPVVGLRYELNAYNDFFVEYQYHLWEGDLSDSAGGNLDDGHGIFVGIVHQFK
jgi:hypothetical protein